MNQSVLGCLVGGVIPALLLGLFSILQKEAAQRGAGPGMLLVAVGAAAILIGMINCWLMPQVKLTLDAGVYAFLTGICWALATSLVQVGLFRFKVPISKLVPLFNMNTLVAVGLGLIIFHEWSTVSSPKLLLAAILVVAGGILAAYA